jgi:uncharacterized membrane protein
MTCGDTLRLQWRIFYRNNFRRFLYCRLLASDRGTLLAGRFRMLPVTTVMTILGLVFAACIDIAMAWTGVHDNHGTLLWSITLGFWAIVGATLAVSRLLSRRGEKKMIALLKSTLEATECGEAERV